MAQNFPYRFGYCTPLQWPPVRRARYLGVRKNLFDVRRAAAVVNLETTNRQLSAAA